MCSPRRGEAEGTKALEGYSVDLHSLGRNADFSLETEERAADRSESGSRSEDRRAASRTFSRPASNAVT